MHVVLQNQDLLREIFYHLRLDHDKKACLNGALVCNTFKNPAQDALWRHLHGGVLPLFKLLSNLRYEEYEGIKTYFMYGTTIKALDLERLKYFGSRVHAITCTERGDSVYIGESAYTAVTTALGDELLVPNLENLRWDFLEHDSSFILRLCCSPHLRKFEAASNLSPSPKPVWSDDVSTFVQRLADDKIELTELMFDIPCSQSVLDIIPSSFPHLQSLQLTLDMDGGIPLGYSFLHALSGFKNLEQLYLHSPNIALSRTSERGLTFQNVSKLGISCPFDDVLALLSASKFPSLSSVFFDFVLPPEILTVYDNDWVQFFKLFHTASTPSKIEEIVVEPYRRYWIDNDLQILAFMHSFCGVPFEDLAEHIFQFDLTEFVFTFPLFESLSMDNLRSIVKIWPRLQILHLHSASDITVGIDGLHLIASHLPNLFNLSICLDTGEEPTNDLPDQLGDHTLELLSLRLANFAGDFTEMSQVASHVDTLFPHIRMFSELHSGFTNADEDERSVLVSLWDVIQSARRRERKSQGIRDFNWFFGRKVYI